MDFSTIVTIGPSILQADKLREINKLGPCIFRLNGAHISSGDVLSLVEFIRSSLTESKVMIDLPGNKIRLTHLPYAIHIEAGEEIELLSAYFNYTDFYKHLSIGDLLLTNNSTIHLEVKKISSKSITVISNYTTDLLPAKGIFVDGINDKLPFLFNKDRELIEAACEAELDYISLSFVRDAKDIQEVKEILKKKNYLNSKLIAKIETKQAVDNLGYIFQEVDIINVDRGDLSASIGMLELPRVQERIIESAKRANKEVFLATEFLKNMEMSPIPLISEIIDLNKTVKSGITGIQLSEETAIGKYPYECVKQIFDVFNSSF